ncbi:hypothetical protein DB29_00606 [Shouchella clausii]|nr:hypothetical protein DB29_00606 [Shouchella clausii]
MDHPFFSQRLLECRAPLLLFTLYKKSLSPVLTKPKCKRQSRAWT